MIEYNDEAFRGSFECWFLVNPFVHCSVRSPFRWVRVHFNQVSGTRVSSLKTLSHYAGNIRASMTYDKNIFTVRPAVVVVVAITSTIVYQGRVIEKKSNVDNLYRWRRPGNRRPQGSSYCRIIRYRRRHSRPNRRQE